MTVYSLGDKKPQLPPEGEYWIAPNAIVLGDVILHRGASIWFNAVLRGDTDTLTVGENSNIQDGSILHADAGVPLVIGRNVTVGHKVMLHGCTLGHGCLQGMKKGDAAKASPRTTVGRKGEAAMPPPESAAGSEKKPIFGEPTSKGLGRRRTERVTHVPLGLSPDRA